MNCLKNLFPHPMKTLTLIQDELKLLYLSLKDNISIGKKVGCTSTEGQKQLDIDEPFYGNLYSRFYSIDTQELSSKKFNKPFIEPEIALRIRDDIDISKAPFTLKDVLIFYLMVLYVH